MSKDLILVVHFKGVYKCNIELSSEEAAAEFVIYNFDLILQVWLF